MDIFTTADYWAEESSTTQDRESYNTSMSWSEAEEKDEPTVSVAAAASQIILGILILCGNTVVLIVLRKVSTLSGLTRFLFGNLAVADCLFGFTCLLRGTFALDSRIEISRFCRHFLAYMTMAVVYTYTTTAVISGHVLYVAFSGVYYNARKASKVSNLFNIILHKPHIKLINCFSESSNPCVN